MVMIEWSSIICIGIGLGMILYSRYVTRKNDNKPTPRKKENYKLCIMIPARNESKVIEELLISIKRQTVSIRPEDIYVIVESQTDPTITIVKQYGMNYFVRNHLELKRKGYALDEMIKEFIQLGKRYDAYFIIDADNVLEEHFMEEMLKTYEDGYDIGIGYRNCKNGNDNLIASCTELTFTMLNDHGNLRKNKETRNVTLSGTGLYIAGTWIEKWQGFPFHTLTEDYELTLYSIFHHMTSYYNKKAIFYDEQPVTYKQSVIQRVRWIRGYFDARKKYIPKLKESVKKKNKNYGSQMGEIIGVKTYIWLVIGVILFLLYQLYQIGTIYLIENRIYKLGMIKVASMLFLIYIIIAFVTFTLIWKERNRLNLSRKMKFLTIFWNPFFVITYVPCALKAILKKEVTWEQVEHNKSFFTEKN